MPRKDKSNPSQPSGAAKGTRDLLDQVVRARQALDYFSNGALNERGELHDGTAVRSHLNAAKAHVIRAMEMAQNL
ncbi:MAG: hypothetical protein HQM03_01235 [Magnetococcales bacterium]|nr:hypothetical protein [Magnetococcales bacterium]